MNAKNLAIVAGAGVAIYLIARTFTAAGKVVSEAYDNSRDAIASGLYALFGPAQDTSTDFYYTVRFADGNHAVPKDSVNADGVFSRNGTNYRLLIDTRIKTGVNKTAFPL
jgi:hypothetical protein